MRRAVGVLAALTLASCTTPYVQPPLTPPNGFAGPAIQPPAAPGLPGTILAHDGARLPYLQWLPAGGEPRMAIVALHGMNDSKASFRLAGPWWAERGIATYAYDQRGFGRAPGQGEWAGEAAMTEDLRTVVALVRARHPNALVAVVGESMGGSVAIAAFASPRPPDAHRLILLAPGVWGWSAQGPVNSASLWVTARALGDLAIEPPEFVTRDRFASDNLPELIRNGTDPDSILSTRFDTLYGLVDLMETASNSLGRIAAPTLLMYGADDQIIRKGAMRRALERAGEAPTLRTAWYPDGYHLLNRDLAAEAVYSDVEAWLRAPFAALPSGASSVLPELR